MAESKLHPTFGESPPGLSEREPLRSPFDGQGAPGPDVLRARGGRGGGPGGADGEPAHRERRAAKPRNPRHFDGIGGGRKRVSTIFMNKNSVSRA